MGWEREEAAEIGGVLKKHTFSRRLLFSPSHCKRPSLFLSSSLAEGKQKKHHNNATVILFSVFFHHPLESPSHLLTKNTY